MIHSYRLHRRRIIPALLPTLLSTVVMLCPPAAHAQDHDVDSALASKFQNLIVEMRASGNGVVGISAAVAMPDSGRWKGATGISGETTALEPDMLQGIGSITKTFVATLVLELAEEGKLSLDDSLHRWLPAYANVDSTATIRQLLAHTSGIFNYLENPAVNDSLVKDLGRIWTPEEIVTNFVLPRDFAPGNGWHYSNTGYVLLGMIAERATGNPVETELRSRLLDPLHLAHTFFPEAEELQGDVAAPWSDVTGDGLPDDISLLSRRGIHSAAWTAGAMFSTPEDLVTWGRALYGGGVLAPASLQQMLSFRTLSFGLSNGYGLGVMRFRVNGRNVYGHGGNVLGYSSIMLYSPTDSITVALIVNETIDATGAGLALMNLAMNSRSSGVRAAAGPARGITLTAVRPDPSGTALSIDCTLGASGRVTATLYNLLGREVASVTEDAIMPGSRTLQISTAGLPAGMYFYRLTDGEHVASGKVAL